MKTKILTFLSIASILLTIPAQVAAAAPAVESSTSGVHLISTTDTETMLVLTLPPYSVETVEGVDGACQQIHVEGAALGGERGAPMLPVMGTLLGVPPQSDLSLEIVGVESETMAGILPCPAPEAVAEEDESGLIRYVERAAASDPAVYAQDALLPAVPATVQDLGFLRSQRLARVAFAPVQVNPAQRTALIHRRIQVRLHHPGSASGRAALASPETPLFESVLGSALLNYESARAWRVEAAVRSAAATSGWTPPSPAYRIGVAEAGIYELTYEDLSRAGLLVHALSPQMLRMFHNGTEIAIRVVDETGADDQDGSFDRGDRVIFFAEQIEDKYAAADVYWLTYGQSNGLRMAVKASADGGPGSTTVATYRATSRYEENVNYVSSTPRASGHDHWYGHALRAFGYGATDDHRVSLTVSALASATGSDTLSASVVGLTAGEQTLRLYLNGVLVHEEVLAGQSAHLISAPVDHSLLRAGTNDVVLELANGESGQSYAISYIDWVRLDYQRTLDLAGEPLLFDGAGQGTWTYAIQGAGNGTLEAYDVSNPRRVVQVKGQVSGSTLTFGSAEADLHRYLVQRIDQRRKPLFIERAQTADLLSTKKGADYIIISHGDFLDAVAPLADHRQQQGLRVEVVDVQHVYDTFSYGRVSAEAIRTFLAYAYEHWAGARPSYVLLVGDGTYDPKLYKGDCNQFSDCSAPTWIPPYLEVVDPVMGETAADNRYVAVAGDDLLPDMQLGRFPARSVAEVEAMVEKTLAYERAEIDDGWNQIVLFVTDDLEGGGGAFYSFSDAIAEGKVKSGGEERALLPSSYSKEKFYLGQTCDDATCPEQIVDAINRGALLVSYVGHASKQYWAGEQLLNLAAVDRLTNGDRLPIMLPMTCLEGYYHEAAQGQEALGEKIVRTANRGAVASWSPTGLGLVTGHDYLERGFFQALFHDEVTVLGDATLRGKIYLIENAPLHKYDDLLDTYNLIGDPALGIRVPGSAAVPTQTDWSVYLPGVRG